MWALLDRVLVVKILNSPVFRAPWGLAIPAIVIATKGWLTVELNGDTEIVLKVWLDEGFAAAGLPPTVRDILKLTETNVNYDGSWIVILSPLNANLGSLVYTKIVQVLDETEFIVTLDYLKVEFFKPLICKLMTLCNTEFVMSYVYILILDKFIIAEGLNIELILRTIVLGEIFPDAGFILRICIFWFDCTQ